MLLRLIVICIFFSISFKIYADDSWKKYDPFRELFLDLRDNPLPADENNPNPIPKIIHQFWVGDANIPDPYIKISDSCKHFESFEYKFWTNQNYKELISTKDEQEAFEAIPVDDHAVQKDFLGYLALKKYGGVMLDMSIMCIKSPVNLHNKYSFYAIYPYSDVKHSVEHAYLAHATVLASAKNSPIINSLVNKFKNYIKNYKLYNLKYTSDNFLYKEFYHGWMNQVVINEVLKENCLQNNRKCRDMRILNKEFSKTEAISQEEVVYVDADHVDLAYIVKTFYNKTMSLEQLLTILSTEYDARIKSE